MFAITVELLRGVFRGDGDGTAFTGQLTQGEWPPSPARLFGAFVAADGTGKSCRVTDGSELQWMERLPPPIIQADPRPEHNPQCDRYVVEQDRNFDRKGHHQEYPARKSVLVRPSPRVSPNTPFIRYLWDEVCPPDVVAALQRRAARIGYLGTSDSSARVSVQAGTNDHGLLDVPEFVPDPNGRAWINVFRKGDLDEWDYRHRVWREYGPSAPRTQFPNLRHEALYRDPAVDGDPAPDRGAVVVWLRVKPAVRGRRISALTEMFKEAVLSKHASLFGEPPPALHGHHLEGQHDGQARYLALPNVEHARADGSILGLALWLPPGSLEQERSRAREAALSVRSLKGYGLAVSVVQADSSQARRAWTTNPKRWCKESCTWTTAIPAIHNHWPKSKSAGPTLADVAEWCRQAGLPTPVDFRWSHAPFIRGGVDLNLQETLRPKKHKRVKRPYSHFEIQFAEPIPGPVVFGSGRQRGFGICIPIDGFTRNPSPRP